MNKFGKTLVICGPSGCGKSTLLERLIQEFTDYLGFTISHTTRPPRAGELHGREYYFTDKETMRKAIENNEFIEHTHFLGNLYGTSKKAVEEVQKRGKICVLDLDIEGVRSMKKTDLNPKFVLIKPPNVNILEERLRKRGTESEENLINRLNRAKEELSSGNFENHFDLVLVNDDVDQTYTALKEFLLPIISEYRKVTDLICHDNWSV